LRIMNHDNDSMQRIDYATVKALKLQAPAISKFDRGELRTQIEKGEIFSTFSELLLNLVQAAENR